MIFLTLGAALAAVIYGLCTAFRPKTPLFYKIVVYGLCCYLLSVVYSLLFALLWGRASAFHAGYLGYAGTFFFLFSSYFGAMDRLADGYDPRHRLYRIVAVLPAAAVLALGWIGGGRAVMLLLLVPVAATAYFACKHLILPDVEQGIIQVMRPYNGLILAWCLLQPFAVGNLLWAAEGAGAAAVLNALAVAAAVPLARMGVRRWFM